MFKPARSLVVACVLTVTLALAASTAFASRTLNVRPAGPIAMTSTAAMTFGASGLTVTCSRVRLEAEINPYVRAVAGEVAGHLLLGAFTSCREPFSTATVTATATPEAPVSIRYGSFLGTLPNIIGVQLTVSQLPVTVRGTLLGTCTYQGDLGFLVVFPGRSGNAVRLTASRFTKRTGGTLCPATAEATGSFTLLPNLSLAGLEQPPPPVRRVVTLGESYMSGEGNRWAGNVRPLANPVLTDAGRDTAYWTNPAGNGEATPGCHRSIYAEAFIGVPALNLACSGSIKDTQAGNPFKPGIDFFTEPQRIFEGQAKMLKDFATRHPGEIKLVALSIGGNEFQFGNVIRECMRAYFFSWLLIVHHCSANVALQRRFEALELSIAEGRIAAAIRNVRRAMDDANYPPGEYKILVQNYPSPIPSGGQFRYPQTSGGREESGAGEREAPWEEAGPRNLIIETGEEGYRTFWRQFRGGCGFWNTDATRANDTVLPAINGAISRGVALARVGGVNNIVTLRLESAFQEHRLCEWTADQLEEAANPPLAFGWAPGSSDQLEWITQIHTAETLWFPYELQEGLHPNYWGVAALRNCLRRAFNNGNPVEGRCRPNGPGLEGIEPRMQLVP